MKKALIGLFALGIFVYVMYSMGLPLYQSNQLEKLNAAQAAAFLEYQASTNSQEKAGLRARWLKLLDEKVAKKTVTSQEVRQAIAALSSPDSANSQAANPADNKALLAYLTLLDISRTPAEQVQYTYLLYVDQERQLTDPVKDAIEKVLTHEPKQPNTLLILAEDALKSKDFDLVRKALPVIKEQIAQKGELANWVQSIEQQLTSQEPKREASTADPKS